MGLQDEDSSTDNAKSAPRPPQAPLLEEIVAAASFPIYGLVGHPDGLTLQGIGGCHVFGNPNRPMTLWQVSLDFTYPPAAQRSGHRLEMTTCDPKHPPNMAITLDGTWAPSEPDPFAEFSAQAPHYPSLADVPLDAPPVAAYVIDFFPLAEETVTAQLRFSARATPQPFFRMADPEWSFTLIGSGMWVIGRANGWPQAEFFALLKQVAAVSQRPDVLAHYQREQTAWRQHMDATRPKLAEGEEPPQHRQVWHSRPDRRYNESEN